MTRTSLAALVAALLLAGCSTTLEDLADEHGAALTAQLGHVAAIRATALAMEPIAAPTVTQPGTSLDFGLTRGLSERNLANNAQVLLLEQLDPQTPGPSAGGQELRTYHAAWLGRSHELAAGNLGNLPSPRQMEDELAQLRDMEFLLVVRTHELTRPVYARGSYVAGAFTGDALLFDLAQERLVAAFPVQVANGDEVQYRQRERDLGPSADGLQDIVMRDLKNQISSALADGLRDHAGAALPSPIPF